MFSKMSMELFVLLGELLSIHPQRTAMAVADVWDDRQRRYIAQRVRFHALEAEMIAGSGGTAAGWASIFPNDAGESARRPRISECEPRI